ncbi:MAG: SPASM domain-containing protein [Candidatus Nanoarchaeia archaeon]|nr:SPASM domain-containing protein [Candidatus Nanoarchaeia archaeon]MDD5358120.1 SPASM domain-containing protein [Candidatus Nanoarchaeia archaeon]MDD5589307.1 SPASM domain-containing protein [Candidatus Nanoarchaeia archaeon]
MKDIETELKSLANRLNLTNLSDSSFFPKYFEIETVHACNAKCKMCPIWKHPEDYGRMEKKLFDKISSEMSGYSSWINSVCLSRNGEPLLDKNLVDKIKTLKNYGIKDVTFSTNASLLNKKKSLELIESGLDDIRFSIDGYTKETFESIRYGLDFENVVENCLQFIRLRNEKGNKPRIRIRMVLQDENRNEETQWKNFWLSKISEQDIVCSKEMNTWGNKLKKCDTEMLEKYSNIPCISPWSTLVSLYDGKVPLCGVDYEPSFNLGDLNSSTIKEIWNSEAYEEIRKIHSSNKRNDIPLCRGCNIWDLEEKKIY